MAIEAMKGAGMSYAGSSSASDVKAESQAKVETASNAAASDDLMKKTIQIDTEKLTGMQSNACREAKIFL